MKQKTKVLYGFGLLMAVVLVAVTNSCAKKETGLKDAFAKHFMIGTALSVGQIMETDGATLPLVIKEFNALTAENIMKWEEINPEPGVFNFGPADSMVNFGLKNNMFIVGHALVWHNQTPDWVFEDGDGNLLDREALLARMKDYIYTVVGHFKGRVHGWDVVNEAVTESGEFRKSKWYNIIGEDFIQKAFEYAYEADPDVELYYNDYNIEKPAKRNGVLMDLISGMKNDGIRIDGVGIQGHWHLDAPGLDEIEQSIIDFANLGVKVMITELDINVLPRPEDLDGADISTRYALTSESNPYPESLPDSMQKVLTDRYADFFNIFVKHSDKISRVTFWGVSDKQSWLSYWPIPGRTNYPLIFDRELNPKPAYYSILETLKK